MSGKKKLNYRVELNSKSVKVEKKSMTDKAKQPGADLMDNINKKAANALNSKPAPSPVETGYSVSTYVHEEETSRIPSWLRNTLIRTALLVVLIASTGFSAMICWFPCQTCEDVMFPLAKDQDDAKRVEKYVGFIVDRVSVRGYDSIKGKWIEGIPPEFHRVAKEKLQDLNSTGLEFERVYIDRVNTYNVQCKKRWKPGECINFEIVKRRVDNKMLFRLQRIY